MMKPISLLSAAFLGLVASSQAAVQLSGAGASFPAPLYQRWAVEFNKANPDVQINYQSVGSGAGIKQFTAGTVDFAASDAAMTDEEIAKVSKGAVMIPATAGSIVVAYNLPGIADLKLSRDAYVGIFLGKITNWNDEPSRRPTPASISPTCRSTSPTARTARARPSSSRSTSPRSARTSPIRSAATSPSPGRSARAARATRA